MAFKEVASLDTDSVVGLGAVDKRTGKKGPLEVEGYYLGSKKIESRKAKSGFSYIHVFQTPEGNLGVWGKTDLDRKILNVSAGTMTKVMYTGKVPTPNGDMFKFKVLHDPDNMIEVSTATTASSASSDEGWDTEDSSTYSNDDESDEESEEEMYVRKQKVQALLNKKKSA